MCLKRDKNYLNVHLKNLCNSLQPIQVSSVCSWADIWHLMQNCRKCAGDIWLVWISSKSLLGLHLQILRTKYFTMVEEMFHFFSVPLDVMTSWQSGVLHSPM